MIHFTLSAANINSSYVHKATPIFAKNYYNMQPC